jgi:hypothetical protein
MKLVFTLFWEIGVMGKVLSGLKRLGKEFFLFSGVLSVWLFVTNMIVLVINY